MIPQHELKRLGKTILAEMQPVTDEAFAELMKDPSLVALHDKVCAALDAQWIPYKTKRKCEVGT